MLAWQHSLAPRPVPSPWPRGSARSITRWLASQPRSIGTIEITDHVVRVTEVVDGSIVVGEAMRSDDITVDLVRAARALDVRCLRSSGHLRAV